MQYTIEQRTFDYSSFSRGFRYRTCPECHGDGEAHCYLCHGTGQLSE